MLADGGVACVVNVCWGLQVVVSAWRSTINMECF